MTYREAYEALQRLEDLKPNDIAVFAAATIVLTLLSKKASTELAVKNLSDAFPGNEDAAKVIALLKTL